MAATIAAAEAATAVRLLLIHRRVRSDRGSGRAEIGSPASQRRRSSASASAEA